MLLRLFGRVTRWRLGRQGIRPCRRRLGEFDVRLYQSEDGAAAGRPPWLLLHGLGSTAMTWGPTLSALRPRCRLWAPELSSLGGTTGPTPGMDVRQATRAMGELLEQRAPDGTATVCGISLGGWVAVRLALERPELVGRLVLINCAGFRDQDWEAVERRVTVATIADVERLYDALFIDTPRLLRWSKRAFLEAYTSPAVRHVLASLSADDAFGEEELATIERSTLLIWGRRDGLFPIAVGRRMAAAMPAARMVELDAAHAMHWEFPDRMNEEIVRFAQESGTPS